MLVATLAIQTESIKSKQGIVEFYKRLDIPKDGHDFAMRENRKSFGVYDYNKKNKLTNNTEMSSGNGKS